MGRLTVDYPRNCFFRVRMTAAERIAMQEAAALAGMSMSDWMRSHAMDRKAAAKAAGYMGGRRGWRAGAPNQGPPPPTFNADRLAQLLPVYQELRHQGVNLNQIAHRMNAQDMPPPPELIAVLAEIRALITKSGTWTD